MSIDSYSPCPCGSGKKIKFCCVDLMPELEKVQRMLDGQQRHAALDHIEKLLVQHPGRAALLAYKVTLQSDLGMVEQARQTIDEFVRLHPTNAVALANHAIVLAGDTSPAAGVDRLQDALEHAGKEIPLPVYESLGALAQLLVLEGHFQAARAHLTLQLRLHSGDQEALALLARMSASPQMPLLLKEDLPMAEAPADAPWRAEFNAALEFAGGVRWREAERRLAALAQRHPQAPAIWQDLAIVRGWLANEAGEVEALRKLAALTTPREEAAEAEAVAQLLDPAAADDVVDELRVTYEVGDVDALLTALNGKDRTLRLPVEGLPREEGTVPPRAAYWLLDQPMPTTGVDIKLDAVPNLIGNVLVFGRETDRPPRVELQALRTDLSAAQTVLGQLAASALGQQTGEEVIEHVPSSQLALNWHWRLPDDTPREHVQQLVIRKRRDVVLNRWPKTPNKLFGGRTPEAAAADPAERLKLLGAILLVDLALESQAAPGLVNELRARLALPTLQEIDPTQVDLRRLPLLRLSRVQVQKLGDDDLLMLYRRAQFAGARGAVRKLASALIARPSLDAKVDKAAVYGSLASLEDDSAKALEYLGQARSTAQAAGKSCARWDLSEFALRIQRGDEREASELLRHIQTRHADEPGVGQMLMQMLYEAGIIGADGRPTAAAASAASAKTQPPGIVVPGAAAAATSSGIWTPGSEAPADGAKKSALWTPGMD
ncbi:MAG TPA: hypothetical protein VG713_17655 [Pirellulales bacterium]|nr:hypothetical protein [Pirellulales bacterium]